MQIDDCVHGSPTLHFALLVILLFSLGAPLCIAAETDGELSLPDLYLPRARRLDAPQPAVYIDPSEKWGPEPFVYRRIYPLDADVQNPRTDGINILERFPSRQFDFQNASRRKTNQKQQNTESEWPENVNQLPILEKEHS